MEVLTKGTVEPLLVSLRDRLENVTDLTVVTGKLFNVRKKSDNSAIQPDTAWTVDADFPMQAVCPIDTTLVAYEAGQTYKLYLKYTSGADAPILGPEFFRVEDD